eukprot:6214847-Pleurochrysis_carterae.AAC.2
MHARLRFAESTKGDVFLDTCRSDVSNEVVEERDTHGVVRIARRGDIQALDGGLCDDRTSQHWRAYRNHPHNRWCAWKLRGDLHRVGHGFDALPELTPACIGVWPRGTQCVESPHPLVHHVAWYQADGDARTCRRVADVDGRESGNPSTRARMADVFGVSEESIPFVEHDTHGSAECDESFACACAESEHGELRNASALLYGCRRELSFAAALQCACCGRRGRRRQSCWVSSQNGTTRVECTAAAAAAATFTATTTTRTSSNSRRDVDATTRDFYRCGARREQRRREIEDDLPLCGCELESAACGRYARAVLLECPIERELIRLAVLVGRDARMDRLAAEQSKVLIVGQFEESRYVREPGGAVRIGT